MTMRPFYQTRAIDTTPRGQRKERRQHPFRRVAHEVIDTLGAVLWLLVIVFVAAEAVYLYGTVGR